jgi:large subunit ribosomal protein L30
MNKNNELKITLIRSPFGCLPKHKACVKGLGLRKLHQTVLVKNTPEILGMVNKVNYLLKVEKA